MSPGLRPGLVSRPPERRLEMAGGFVWFALRTTDHEGSKRFYERLLGCVIADPTGAEVALWQAAA
jgi:hypothetical protein